MSEDHRMGTVGRGRRWVEIVDEAGAFRGASPVEAAHTRPGRLHRAFSVVLYNAAGQVLVQRRAETKSRFAGRWANSCCGHPGPGEELIGVARLRIREELGIGVAALAEAGRFTYRAVDPATGRVEHEYDHVLVGRAGHEPVIDLDEVAEWYWADPDRLRADARTRSAHYAPWLGEVLDLAEAAE